MRDKGTINRGHNSFVFLCSGPQLSHKTSRFARGLSEKRVQIPHGACAGTKCIVQAGLFSTSTRTGISRQIEETDMGYIQERHIPSRAEIVVGMIGDAIRRVSDRREFA